MSSDNIDFFLAHELKNIMTIIQGYIELGDSLKALKAVSRAENLINSILKMAKLEGSIEESFSVVDLQEVIFGCKNHFRLLYPDAKLEIKSESFSVKGDFFLLEAVVMNLLDNAVKHAKGLITLELKKSKLIVSDEGNGIPEESLDTIFKEFYRIGGSGSGIGLYFVKKVLEKHGATIRAVNRVKGASFEIYFNERL